MPDGRKVEVDFLSMDSIMAVQKEDWKVISVKIKEAIEFVNSPKFAKNFYRSLGLKMPNK